MSEISRQILIWMLDCYILWFVGHLNAADEARREAVSPKLRAIFHAEGTWQEVLRAAMRWERDPAAEIVVIWKKSEDQARQWGEVIDPDDFAKRFVGMNFIPEPP
ncbi:hypothetical protein [Corallococcus silvisoli]|uniref:hypothetical protein n=1 Tax=Corallococcus silvisoli TaxID=2697031 RepID=UPI0013772C86|nr:hypothetical protein [Corallococcus silvisoli]NBD09940.1 hypothetical protein [Corallococcus silvisoli]